MARGTGGISTRGPAFEAADVSGVSISTAGMPPAVYFFKQLKQPTL
jgi:hypothetical protein